MAFNNENKVSWEELAPSAQELFKSLQTQIVNEANARRLADEQLRNEISALRDELIKMINDRLTILETKFNNLFDSEGRLVFPNNDKFWIG